MNADFFYTTALGRGLMKAFNKTGAFRLAAWFLHTRASSLMIKSFIKNNGIDMEPYRGQSYGSFSDFFARKKNGVSFPDDPSLFLSPCDCMLTVYEITDRLEIPMKGSLYTVEDLAPDGDIARRFAGGLCLVFRLEATDYHHFCFFDDGTLRGTHYIPGQLHSVQPIACRSLPVFRLNRRWWSVMDTRRFGTVVQTEIGAMVVGGVTFAKEKGAFSRGEEMGNFELAGSTIVLLLDADARRRLTLNAAVSDAFCGNEVKVSMGQELGSIVL